MRILGFLAGATLAAAILGLLADGRNAGEVFRNAAVRPPVVAQSPIVSGGGADTQATAVPEVPDAGGSGSGPGGADHPVPVALDEPAAGPTGPSGSGLAVDPVEDLTEASPREDTRESGESGEPPLLAESAPGVEPIETAAPPELAEATQPPDATIRADTPGTTGSTGSGDLPWSRETAAPPLPPAAGAPVNSADGWEAFFSPFRSEASAHGFAEFLRRTTGREFDVRRAGPGDYRVWFRLAPGESHPQRMAEIEAATGMLRVGGKF